MRSRISTLSRFAANVVVAKHRIFVWMSLPTLPDHQVFVFARDDDYWLGVLHGHFHEVWALKQGTGLETRLRYTPTTCFETFPFPRPTPAQEAAIAAAAKELNELRECWLNPPEWTETRVLEFPGTVGGPWDRYIDRATVQDRGGFKVGTVRYPRLETRDADCAAKLKKRTLTNLYNERPAWLHLAHKKLDVAVAEAYGWTDFAEIIRRLDAGLFYDLEAETWTRFDATPAQLRAAIAEAQRKLDEKILERLLALNLERAAEEEAASKTAKPRRTPSKREDELI